MNPYKPLTNIATKKHMKHKNKEINFVLVGLFVALFAALLKKLRDHAGPTGLVTGAYA